MKNILIIADIEGSSGCWSEKASSYKTKEWAKACVDMSLDINEAVKALFNAGVKKVTVKDFHRTAYNLLPELIDSRARVVQGYKIGPIPGIGDPEDADAVMLIGMHAASGSDGFLAHTLTSRISRLEVNGKLMPEMALFTASMAPYGIAPVFFSGCRTACIQARESVKDIAAFSIDKSRDEKVFDKIEWRKGLAESVVESLKGNGKARDLITGPVNTVVSMRDGERPARSLAERWGHESDGNKIIIHSSDLNSLYHDLIRICYLTPFIEKTIVPCMFLYNLYGSMGLSWVRRQKIIRNILRMKAEE